MVRYFGWHGKMWGTAVFVRVGFLDAVMTVPSGLVILSSLTINSSAKCRSQTTDLSDGM